MLQNVLSLALEAGQKIMHIDDEGGVKQQEKSDGSPLIAAGFAAHCTIVEGLNKMTPE